MSHIVIPSINCHFKDSACVQEKLRLIQTFSSWAHLDIADGIFTFHKSWNEPEKWPPDAGLNLEVHCMVEDPLPLVNMWNSAASISRFILHVETLTPGSFHDIQQKVRGKGRSVMLALNPETPVERLQPYLEDTLQFQIMAVHPGLSGQKFLPQTIKKISWIQNRIPNAIIEVDGGITPETARLARAAGGDIMISDNYIFHSSDPKAAYEQLTSL